MPGGLAQKLNSSAFNTNITEDTHRQRPKSRSSVRYLIPHHYVTKLALLKFLPVPDGERLKVNVEDVGEAAGAEVRLEITCAKANV
ncbi:hypothetical protein N0V82_007261 [Gnomoniopsis sp. IMI 355080]|nr:hypothetical protein N0V82_007261 [Gnomoniopsis sp. IMI 355080]